MSATDDTPFSISPNPLSLYLTDALEGVLFKTRFTINKRQGLTVILGDNGLGKSTIVRYLHTEFDARDDVKSVFIPTPNYSSEFAFMQALSAEMGLEKRRSILAHQQELEAWLAVKYAEGKNVVLFVDEAQRLSNKMLEVVRALLNYETDDRKLIQVVLAGQLELRTRLLSESQKALYSRLMAPSLLSPLTLSDMSAMLAYRCKRAKIKNPFDTEALERLYTVTDGVPRAVLRLCVYAYEMMLTFKFPSVSADMVDQARQEVSLDG